MFFKGDVMEERKSLRETASSAFPAAFLCNGCRAIAKEVGSCLFRSLPLFGFSIFFCV
jgi:hypothetical protein